MNVASLITMVTLTLFALRSWAFYPVLVLVLLTATGSVFSLATSLQRRRLSAESHRRLVSEYAPDSWPSVDVLLPTCGEPLEVLSNTYRYVAAMQWTGVVTHYVLDDSDRSEVRELAEVYGLEYRVRPNLGELKKAGNLHYGYTNSVGEFVVILDADFCPRHDFLTHLIPYFDDEAVGIVQSPQVFNTTAGMNWLERGAGSTQELFYRWIQPARDAVGAAICVGTSAVYRRRALDANGGFARLEHSEDVYTGLELFKRGFTLRYVPIQVSKGLCPDSMAAFVNQQYRWCLGSISLLVSREFHDLPLTFTQRVAHWSGFLFYLSTAVGVMAAELPGLLVFLFLAAQIEAWQYLGLLPALWIKLVLIPSTFTSSLRFEVQRVEMIYGFAHIVAVLDGIRGRAAAWVPTSAVSAALDRPQQKGTMALPRKVAILATGTLTTLLTAMVVAIVTGVSVHGLASLWMPTLLVAIFSYTAVPVLLAMLPLVTPRLHAGLPVLAGMRNSTRGMRTTFEPQINHPMAWPEATAWTSTLVCVAVAALSNV